MKIKTPTDAKFKNYHSLFLKHLRIKSLQAKTVDAYERAIKRKYLVNCCGAPVEIIQTRLNKMNKKTSKTNHRGKKPGRSIQN